MNGPNICVHCRLDHGNEPCQQSCENNREDLRNSPSTSGLPKSQRYNLTPQPDITKPYGFDVYPPLGSNDFRPTGPSENCNFSHSRSSTPVGSPNLEQFNQTFLALSTQNQTAINQLVKTQMSQKEAFTMMAAAEEKRGYNLDFASIPIFSGKDKLKFHKWFRCTQHTCAYSNRNLCHKLLHRSAGAVTTVLLKLDKNARDEKIKKILQEYFRERQHNSTHQEN